MDRFQQDLNSIDQLHHIQADIQFGIDSGVDSTPTFFSNGVRYQGDTELTMLLDAIAQSTPTPRPL